MDWKELVAEFRSLGGTADNVALGEGPFGRGLFAIDPAKQVELRTPETLLVRSEDVEIRDGQLVAKASANLGERERAFFDRRARGGTNLHQDAAGDAFEATGGERRGGDAVGTHAENIGGGTFGHFATLVEHHDFVQAVFMGVVQSPDIREP